MHAGEVLSSPHAWGCFYEVALGITGINVFPTRVGVFLPNPLHGGFSVRLPHTRGGVSSALFKRSTDSLSSPHAWGCFPDQLDEEFKDLVFPTRVGVFLLQSADDISQLSLPHTRGGVSKTASSLSGVARSSPHAWGCFPFQI